MKKINFIAAVSAAVLILSGCPNDTDDEDAILPVVIEYHNLGALSVSSIESSLNTLSDDIRGVELTVTDASLDLSRINQIIDNYKEKKFKLDLSQCSNIKNIGDRAFENCTNLTSVIIPGSVTRIGEEAFKYCSGLISIIVPDSVKSIGENAFRGCTVLTSAVIGNGAEFIDTAAFLGCSILTNVTIGSGITSIGYSAFYGCGRLTSLTVKATAPPTFGSDMLKDCSSLSDIYVPNGSVDGYKSARGWKSYSSKIKAIE